MTIDLFVTPPTPPEGVISVPDPMTPLTPNGVAEDVSLDRPNPPHTEILSPGVYGTERDGPNITNQ